MELRALVVDNQKDLADLIGEGLSFLGFEVVKSHGAGEALKIWREQSFDIIISNVYMPGTNGLELLKYIRQEDDTTPMMACSEDRHGLAKALRKGYDAILAQPFHMLDMINSLTLIFQKRGKNEIAQQLIALTSSIEKD